MGGIIDITEDMCIQEGWVKEVVPLAQKRMSIINKVRSRPYQSERDNQQDTTYELCNFWKLHACKSMTTNNCWNKSCPDHDEYGSPCSFQSERDKVLELLRLKYVEFLNHPCPELADKYDHCCDTEWCGLCTLDEVLEELRQKAGEL